MQPWLKTIRWHGLAVIGCLVLTPSAEDCRQALEDIVTAFCLGHDALGFPP